MEGEAVGVEGEAVGEALVEEAEAGAAKVGALEGRVSGVGRVDLGGGGIIKLMKPTRILNDRAKRLG